MNAKSIGHTSADGKGEAVVKPLSDTLARVEWNSDVNTLVPRHKSKRYPTR